MRIVEGATHLFVVPAAPEEVVAPAETSEIERMLKRESIPNLVTGARLLALPVLWGFTLAGYHLVVGAGLLFAWLSDALDGFLARRFNAESAWGSQLDSLSDSLMFASAVVWVVLLRPEFVVEHAPVLLLWVGIGVVNYSVSWIRFRRLVDVHLLSAKAANFLGFLFAAYLIAFGVDSPMVTYGVIGVCLLAAIETFLVVTTFERVDERIRTVFRRPSKWYP